MEHKHFYSNLCLCVECKKVRALELIADNLTNVVSLANELKAINKKIK